MKRFSCALVLVATLNAVAPAIADNHPALEIGKDPVVASDYLAVTGHPIASKIAVEILEKGGSAVDAAIAAQMVLNLVEPQSSGIGGGGFLLHWDAGNRFVTSYDGRETAPAAATTERFVDEDGNPRKRAAVIPGGLSVGVPGLVAMLDLAHQQHGSLPWADLIAPAIKIAEDGFPVSKRLSNMLARFEPEDFDEASRSYFFTEDGQPVAAGTVLTNAPFAETLRLLSDKRSDAFYLGDVAVDIATAVQASDINPGDMTPQDLADYVAKEREPVCGVYQRRTVCSMGPPSSGGLTILQNLTLSERPYLGPVLSAQALHTIFEGQKLAFADRRKFMADSDYVEMPDLLNAEYLQKRQSLISRSSVITDPQPGNPPSAPVVGEGDSTTSPGTTHLSIVDADGNAVALTSTIETAFGSRMMVRGFLLNNELTDFSFRAEDKNGNPIANRVEPGKRPRSSMAPTIVFSELGELEMVTGSPGGPNIIPYIVKSIVGHVDWGLDAQEIADLPNFAARGKRVVVEKAMADRASEIQRLRALGHAVETTSMTSGLNLIIRRTNGTLEGGADPRRTGQALGK